MSQFSFVTDDDSEAYCTLIVQQMTQLFDIAYEEAVGRINCSFAGQSLVGPLDWVYHEVPKDHARFIYYKPGTYWWLEGVDLTPRPYPEKP